MKTAGLIISIIYFGYPLFAQEAHQIEGQWYSEKKNFLFEITENAQGRYEGKIIWSDNPKAQDRYGKPLVGMVTLRDLRYAGNGRYEDGSVYAPGRGRSFDAEAIYITRSNPEVLEVVVSAGFITRTQRWTRKGAPSKQPEEEKNRSR